MGSTVNATEGAHLLRRIPSPRTLVDLPLGSLFRHLSGQSKVQAGGLTLASGLALETTWEDGKTNNACGVVGWPHSMGLSRTSSEGMLEVGKRAVRGPWLCMSGNPAKWFSKHYLRVVFLLNPW